ncbi:TetR family transcriptional regulator [Bacillus oleivorans]|uniref:TetR family transcriptional regulator n=1 Tax=Bacillus oleivorans TaxID=1448271 RepID=A0A285D4T8_9BACI|nr:TetR family transcriptional regulator [Bacillus oleivorans]
MNTEIGSKGKESRRRLLETAAIEFATQGFHDTKVSTIVKKAGLTQPSFYLYFTSKEAIFEELVTNFYSNLRKLTESLRLVSGIEQIDVSKRVLAAVESVFRFLGSDPHLTRIGFFLSPEAIQIKSNLTLVLKENLLAEQRLGYFNPELDMDIVAECLTGMIVHLTNSYLLPGTKDSESLAAQVVNLLINGMLPK